MKTQTKLTRTLGLGTALLFSSLCLAQEQTTRLSFSSIDRGRLEDVFRGAQMVFTLDLELMNSSGKVLKTVNLGATQKVYIPSDQTRSDETREIALNSDDVFHALRQKPKKATIFRLRLKYFDVDVVKNDVVQNVVIAGEWEVGDTHLSALADSVVGHVKQRYVTPKSFIDWEEIKIHYYEVDVDDYKTVTESGYHYGYNFTSGEFEYHWGIYTRRVYVGSHKETRSYQTGGGTKASFDLKAL